MYQQKKQWCVLHAKLFKLFVGGALLLAVSPAYAAGDNYSGTGSTHEPDNILYLSEYQIIHSILIVI